MKLIDICEVTPYFNYGTGTGNKVYILRRPDNRVHLRMRKQNWDPMRRTSSGGESPHM
jgi:hypothetical protein